MSTSLHSTITDGHYGGLRRNYTSTIRQNFNHWILRNLAGFLLHPKIQYSDDAFVADLGCGTGIWLQELAESLPPPAALRGFDSSTAHFPAPGFWRANVSLEKYDCLSPWPKDQLGTYDIVHARFAKCFLDDDNIHAFLHNVSSILKPQGYFQWFEALDSGKVYSISPTAPRIAHAHMASTHKRPKKPSSWQRDISQLLRANGMELVASDPILYREAWRQAWAHSALLGLEDVAAASPDPAHRGKVSAYIDQLADEIEQGVHFEMDLVCWVARKL